MKEETHVNNESLLFIGTGMILVIALNEYNTVAHVSRYLLTGNPWLRKNQLTVRSYNRRHA